MQWYPFALGLSIIACAVSARGAQDEHGPRLAHQLQSLGYENICVETTDSTLVVWCENRRIRYPVVWMVEALALAAAAVPPETEVRVVAEKLARPVVSLAAKADDVRRWMSGELPTEEFRERLEVAFSGSDSPSARENPSLRRVDLTIGPGRLLSQFGVPGVWIKAHFDVSAELATALAPGMTAYGRMFVPLHNRGGPVDGDDRYNELRLGSFLVSYFHSISSIAFSTVTAGLFELGNWRYDSYGVMLDLRHYTPDGRWTIGGSVGCLASARYRVLNDRTDRYRVWEIAWPPRNSPYEALISYWHEGFDLRITGRWGRYLNGDHAWKLEIERTFGEVGLAVFGIKSDAQFSGADRVDRQNVRLLGGVRIEIPLYPRQRGMPERFRVTSASTFAWTYRYRVGHVGVDVATKHGVEDLIAGYNPSAVRNNLERARAQVRASHFQEERVRRGVTTSLFTGNETP